MDKPQYNTSYDQSELQQFLIPRNFYKDGIISGRRTPPRRLSQEHQDQQQKQQQQPQHHHQHEEQKYPDSQQFYKDPTQYRPQNTICKTSMKQTSTPSEYRTNSIVSQRHTTIRGDIGGTSSMRMSRPKLNQMIQSSMNASQKSRKNSREQSPIQYSYNTDPRRQFIGTLHRMSSLTAKGWRVGSPEFKSDSDRESVRSNQYVEQQKADRNQSGFIRNPVFSNIREQQTQSNNTNSTESAYNNMRNNNITHEQQKLYISRNQFIARNHIFLNTFLQMVCVGLLIFMIFYGNWTCRSSNSNETTQTCFTLFQMKTYDTFVQYGQIFTRSMSNKRGSITSSQSFADCIQTEQNDKVKNACRRYLWGGLGYVIINVLGILLNIYSIFCSLGIVMLWNIPFKQSSMKFIKAGVIVNWIALTYWFFFEWTDPFSSLSPCPIIVLLTLIGATATMMHFNYFINKIVKNRLMQALLESHELNRL